MGYENERLRKGAAEGNLPVVEAALASAIDWETEEEDDDGAFVLAASGGHIEVVECLLAFREWAPGTVQAAFEAAADAGHVELARRLVKKGADPQAEYAGEHDEGMRCPVCFRPVSPGACEVCEHYVCTACGCSEPPIMWWCMDEAFRDAVTELVGFIRSREDEDGWDFDELTKPAPPVIRTIVLRVLQDDYLFWTGTGESVPFDIDHGLVSDSLGDDYFHPDPDFRAKVRAQCLETLAWLRETPPPSDDE